MNSTTSSKFELRVGSFQSAARSCAMTMLENATYIQAELDRVQMPEPMRTRTIAVCEALIRTKHDVIHEIFDIDELLLEQPDPALISGRMARVIQWMSDDVRALHQLVKDLESAAQDDAAVQLAYLLISESAVNILNALGLVMDAVE
jgi:hypothetical protein